MFVRKYLLLLIVVLVSADLLAQTPIPLGPQVATYNDTRVRGYHFTATSTWSLCGLYIPTDNSTGPMNVEFVRFTQGPPPPFAGTTNNFVSLFYAAGVAGTNMINVPNVPVTNGNIYGTYGARSNPGNLNQMMNSYGTANTVTNVNGINMTLQRSGMQFPLNNQQMHDIWSEVNFFIGRVIMYHSCCPQPLPPQGPISGPASVCQGDTVVYSIPPDPNAVSYTWSVGPLDTVITGQGTTSVSVAIGPNSIGDSVCVFLTDTCTDSDPICFGYTVPLPPTPGAISGPDTVCTNDTATYSIPSVTGVTYSWTVPPGATIISNPNSNTIDVVFGTNSDSICVQLIDSCATGGTSCAYVEVSTSPPFALAGVDQNICSGLSTTLQGNNPQIGTGLWTIENGPGGGSFANDNDPLTSFSNLQPGTYTLKWTISSAACPSSHDFVDVEVGITPDASFDAPDACEGSLATFTNTTETFGLQGSYLWDIDNDGIDNYLVESPVHQYPGPGTYVVRLIASAQGCADTIVQPINVNPLPVMNVNADDQCLETPVDFINNTVIASGAISQMMYDFGDGSTPEVGNAGLSPLYSYASAGDYTAIAYATSDQGCVDSQLINLTVHHLPVPNFSFKNSCQYQTTEFFDQSSVQASFIDEWDWSFGDGSSSDLEDTEHDYAINGDVPVTLRVWSALGCSSDTTIPIEVYPTPVSQFNFTNEVCLGDSMYVENTSTIDYGFIQENRWHIEDTNLYYADDTVFYFSEVGWYKVGLLVTSDQGCRSYSAKRVPVWAIPDADYYFEGACAGDSISFRDTSRFSEGSVDAWLWQFGDTAGSTSAERHPTFLYEDFGEYNVSLTVFSSQKCPSTVTYPVQISEYIEPEFVVSIDSGCSPLLVQMTDSSVSKSGIGYSMEWAFGNGDTIGNGANQYTYYLQGGRPYFYDVTMRITSDAGCVTESTKDSLIYLMPQPIADFTTEPNKSELTTQRPLVQFVSLAEETNYWKWQFGDGNSSIAHNPAHQYADEGEYLVTLIARNIFQCSDTVSDRLYVEPINRAFIPSAFTPNGDGRNETFKVYGLKGVTEFTMDIYDRWGRKVYSTTGVNSSWDGTNVQSSVIQQGLYTYKINYIDVNGDPVTMSGEVSVVGVDN